MIYTDEMVAYIVIKRTVNQWTWKRVSEGFNKKFQTNRPANTLSLYYKNNILISNTTYNQEEIDYLHGCFLNAVSDDKTIKGFYEFFGRRIKMKDYKWVIKNCESTHPRLQTTKAILIEQKILKEKTVKNMKTRTSRKGIHNKKWTEEEHAGLFTITSGKEQIAYAEKIGKSFGAVKQRMYNHKINMTKNKKSSKTTKPKTIKAEKTKPKKTKAKTKKTYTPRWTEEEDYDLICNFYELSIDQARNRFNRSYGVIATRLEKLVDSTQPKHEEMLMRAAKEIKTRKEAVSKPVKLSRRERRKARKQAKLAKRIAKMKAKIQE